MKFTLSSCKNILGNVIMKGNLGTKMILFNSLLSKR